MKQSSKYVPLMVDLERAMNVAKDAAEAGSAAALPHWEKGVVVERKADRSPVTVADKESEAAIVAVIRRAFPDHALLTEESGVLEGDPSTRWIVDPLDGTRGFTRGGKFWGPLVALEVNGEILAGAMAMPVLGTTYWAARGLGCFKDGERCRVSRVGALDEATLSLGEMGPLMAPPHGGAVIELIREAASARGYGDLAGCALLLDGQAEVWLEAGVKPWDIAPHKILLEEAGGRFTNFEGGDTLEPGTAIGSNGALHETVLARIRTRVTGA